jgi:hypothetical protein
LLHVLKRRLDRQQIVEISTMGALRTALMLSTLASVLALSTAGTSSAFPLGRGATAAAPVEQMSPLIQVRNRSARIAAGVIGGLIVGGLIASHWPYRYGYPYSYYYPYPYYPAYRVYPFGDPIAYCIRRFRSYDPYSMTYLGYDGRRHYCP